MDENLWKTYMQDRLRLGKEMLNERGRPDDVASLASETCFMPRTTGASPIVLTLSHVLVELSGKTVFQTPYASSQGALSAAKPETSNVAFVSCAIQTAMDNKLCPSVSFVNVGLSLIKCKIRLGTWFSEGVVGNQIPVLFGLERVVAVIRHCDLVEGKIKTKVNNRIVSGTSTERLPC